MRELELPEIETVSGGTRLNTVVGVGTRGGSRDPFLIRMQIDALSQDSGNLFLAQGSDDSLFDGGGGSLLSDPSPGDGVPGLNVQEVGDFEIQITAEVDGHFDSVLEDGEVNIGETELNAGDTFTIEDTPENRAFLGLYVPDTPNAGV